MPHPDEAGPRPQISGFVARRQSLSPVNKDVKLTSSQLRSPSCFLRSLLVRDLSPRSTSLPRNE